MSNNSVVWAVREPCADVNTNRTFSYLKELPIFGTAFSDVFSPFKSQREEEENSPNGSSPERKTRHIYAVSITQAARVEMERGSSDVGLPQERCGCGRRRRPAGVRSGVSLQVPTDKC